MTAGPQDQATRPERRGCYRLLLVVILAMIIGPPLILNTVLSRFGDSRGDNGRSTSARTGLLPGVSPQTVRFEVTLYTDDRVGHVTGDVTGWDDPIRLVSVVEEDTGQVGTYGTRWHPGGGSADLPAFDCPVRTTCTKRYAATFDQVPKGAPGVSLSVSVAFDDMFERGSPPDSAVVARVVHAPSPAPGGSATTPPLATIWLTSVPGVPKAPVRIEAQPLDQAGTVVEHLFGNATDLRGLISLPPGHWRLEGGNGWCSLDVTLQPGREVDVQYIDSAGCVLSVLEEHGPEVTHGAPSEVVTP